MCNCERCNLSRKVTALREHLVRSGASSVEHIETLDQLYSEYVHDSMDHEWLQAVVDNKWPSSGGYMKTKGWFREEEKELI